MPVYATRQDLFAYGLNELSVQNINPVTLDAQLSAASAWADSKLAGRYNLPLLAWDASITMNVCYIAAWNILSKSRGFNPDNPGDVAVRQSYDDAIAWFNAVERQNTHPTVTQTPTAAPNYQLPQVSTGVRRGY